MGLFFPMDGEKSGAGRKKGFARYRQLLERDWKQMILMDFISLAFIMPCALLTAYAALAGNTVLLLIAAGLGGMLAGQGVVLMYDYLLRLMRDERPAVTAAFKRSLRQNFRSALLPGAAEGLFFGVLTYTAMYMTNTGKLSFGNIVLLLAAAFIVTCFLSLWWPQTALYTLGPVKKLKNCVLFMLMNPVPVLKCAAMQVIWWTAGFLFMPWTAFLVPILGIWYITFASLSVIYDKLNEAFKVEEQIRQQFPGQIPEEESETES